MLILYAFCVNITNTKIINYLLLLNSNEKWRIVMSITMLTNAKKITVVKDEFGRYKYYRENGELLNKESFEYVYDFIEGISLVKNEKGYNYIRENGTLISKEWFFDADEFVGGFAAVLTKNGWNYLKPDGSFLCDECFEDAYDFKEGFGLVKRKDGYNYIKPNGKFLSMQWFEQAEDFNKGFASVFLVDWCCIKRDGMLITN